MRSATAENLGFKRCSHFAGRISETRVAIMHTKTFGMSAMGVRNSLLLHVHCERVNAFLVFTFSCLSSI